MAISQIQSASLASGVPASSNMPTGSVLQVVYGTYTTTTSTTNGLASPVATGLTATITPKFATSKILIVACHPQSTKGSTNASTDIAFWIYKNGGAMIKYNSDLGYTATANFNYCSSSFTYLDSPATTSSTTYATYFANGNSTGEAVNTNNSGISTITLMEIAA